MCAAVQFLLVVHYVIIKILFAMKKSSFFPILLLFLPAAVLTGCDLVVDIFQAGVWVGVILVIVVIVLVIWLLRKLFS